MMHLRGFIAGGPGLEKYGEGRSEWQDGDFHAVKSAHFPGDDISIESHSSYGPTFWGGIGVVDNCNTNYKSWVTMTQRFSRVRSISLSKKSKSSK
jgi:hypothetical protein